MSYRTKTYIAGDWTGDNYAIKKFSENKVKVYFGSSLGDKALRVKIWDFFPNRLES